MTSSERLRVVLDTNIIIAAAPEWSPYRIIIDKLLNQEYEAYITTEILLEYEEKIDEFFGQDTVELIVGSLTLLPNVIKQEVYFNFSIIQDKDDNKFIDCAFAANVHFIVSNDKDFNILKTTDFPKIRVVKMNEFLEILNTI